MNKPIWTNMSDDEFMEIVNKSKSMDEIGRALGFKHRPGSSSRKKIKDRIASISNKEKVNCIDYKDYNNLRKHQPRESNFKKTTDLGTVGEKYLEFICAKMQIPIMRPISDTVNFDHVILINNRFLRIQVKTTEFLENKLGDITFMLRHGNDRTTKCEKYSIGDFDYFFLFCNETNESFLIPFDKERQSIVLRERKNAIYTYNTSNYKDEYTFEKVISTLLCDTNKPQ